MIFTKKQKAAVKALVSCHETGKPIGNYSALVVLKDDAGITYGCHQATHKSGSLAKIVQMYVNVSDSPVSKQLEPYVAGLKNPSLRHKYAVDTKLKNLLKEAGKEPAMRYAQDKVFEVNYFEPALRAVTGSGWTTPLALAVVYDSLIQGGWTTVRDRVKGNLGEKAWIKSFVAERRRWLSDSSRQVVRNSVYRMKTFETLIANDNWELETPFTVHGAKVTADHLAVWMSADEAVSEDREELHQDSVSIDAPAPEYFVGNTEGIAEEVEAEDIEGEPMEIEKSPEESTDKETGDPPKAGEPVPDAPAQEGEAIVGGRPQDPPVIIEEKKAEETSGFKTWTTTVLGFFGSIGVTATGAGTWIWGSLQDPTSKNFFIALIIIGIVLGAIFGIVYLIIRAIDKSRREQQAHQIMLKELELKSMPDRYNVKVDRRGDVSNLTASGLPIKEKRSD